MVHLLPLPGSPQWNGDLNAVLDHAKADAVAIASGSADAIIVENYGDVPLYPKAVGPHTVSAMTVAVREVQSVTNLPVGVNVLRNDARSAMAIASVTGADFIRVNVHTGTMVTDEGIIEGMAYDTLRYRRELGSDVSIFADVLVKHAVPLGDQDLWLAARTVRERGLADALIVSGSMTGEQTSVKDIEVVKDAVSDVPVLVGSGLDMSNANLLFAVADGAIVGTSLKRDGNVKNTIDVARVEAIAKAAISVNQA